MKIRTLPILACLLVLMTAACSENDKLDEFHDWQSRNDAYMDSIADYVNANYTDRGISQYNAVEGDMFRILSYRLDPAVTEREVSDYVYCRVLKKGDGTVSPAFTDEVLIDYRCRLIPTEEHPDGFVADQSFKTETFDPSTNIPASFKVSELVNGMATAIPAMKEGDIWRIYIPYRLGYNKTERSSIPAYSTLVFDVRLAEIPEQN